MEAEIVHSASVLVCKPVVFELGESSISETVSFQECFSSYEMKKKMKIKKNNCGLKPREPYLVSKAKASHFKSKPLSGSFQSKPLGGSQLQSKPLSEGPLHIQVVLNMTSAEFLEFNDGLNQPLSGIQS